MRGFRERILSGGFDSLRTYSPYMEISFKRYWELATLHDDQGVDLETAMMEFKVRVSNEQYNNSRVMQSIALNHSRLAFPSYRFILPEVIANDWLAQVGWHKYSRDHVVHQPLVAYLVLELLDENSIESQGFKFGGKSLIDRCVDAVMSWDGTSYIREYLLDLGLTESSPWFDEGYLGRFLWKGLFKETAYLAALYHDMGYPWQYINMISNKLAHVEYIKDSPNSDAEKLFDIFGDRLLYHPFKGYRRIDSQTPSNWKQEIIDLTSIALRKSHGFPGAIGFLYMNDVIRDYPKDDSHPIRQFCVEWASMAMLMHDMGKLYWGDKNGEGLPQNEHLRLDFDKDPLSCIITLADVLEDFERPTAIFSPDEGTGDYVNLRYEADCESTELIYDEVNDPGILKMNYILKNSANLELKNDFVKKENKEYFHPQLGFVDLSSLGINEVQTDVTSR